MIQRVFIFLLFSSFYLFPDDYRICFSSVNKNESAVVVQEKLKAAGIYTITEKVLIGKNTFIRVLDKKSFSDYDKAEVQMKEYLGLLGNKFKDIWILKTENFDIPENESEFNSDAIFAKHKENFVIIYDFLTTFLDEPSIDVSIQMASSAEIFIKLMKDILEDFTVYLPVPLSILERTNQAARDIQLSSKVSFLQNRYVERSNEKLYSLIPDIQLDIKDNLEKLSSKYESPFNAVLAKERIVKNVNLLQRLMPESSDNFISDFNKAEKYYKAVINDVDSNILPNSLYEAKDRIQLEIKIASLYGNLFPSSKIEKVIIFSDKFNKRFEAEIVGEEIFAVSYSYLDSFVVTSSSDEDFLNVVYVSCKKNKIGDLEINLGESYSVSKDNL